MDAGDLKKRAAWLLAVSARLSSREVAEMLAGYADEMLEQAECIELRRTIRRRAARDGQFALPSPFPADRPPVH
jgi:hypothetical protein